MIRSFCFESDFFTSFLTFIFFPLDYLIGCFSKNFSPNCKIFFQLRKWALSGKMWEIILGTYVRFKTPDRVQEQSSGMTNKYEVIFCSFSNRVGNYSIIDIQSLSKGDNIF
jgi:hypothetical protein